MALYTILFGLSIFLIALVMAIIKKMFFHWKEEHKIEQMVNTTTDRPAVSVLIYTDKCVIRQRKYPGNLQVNDIISKSDISIQKANLEEYCESHNELERPSGEPNVAATDTNDLIARN